MSQQEVRAAKATHETCRNCKRWHDWGDDMGRCVKFTHRIVMTFKFDTCKNFSEKKEVEKMRDLTTTTHVDRLAPDVFMCYLEAFLLDAQRRGIITTKEYKPVKVIYNGITTIAIFSDGQKIISRPSEDEWFDKETGLAMCIAKRVYGGRGQFLKAVDDATVQPVKSEDSCSMNWIEALNEIVNSLSRFMAENKKETDEQ